MKQKFKNILSNPKRTTLVALIIAIALGAWSAYAHNKTMSALFAKIAQDQASFGTTPVIGSHQDLTLAFPVGGRIKSVSVKIGDKVTAGTVLASLDAENVIGAMNQAKAAYTAAQTAYDKLVNGTSTPDIDIAKVALANAKSAQTNTIAQQKVLVDNAHRTMLNSGLAAIPAVQSNSQIISPTISGTYTGATEGVYTISVYATSDGNYFSFTGLEDGSGQVSAVATPLGTRGLYISFPSNFTLASNTVWTVSIPNTQSATYLTYYNAYQSALQAQTQAIAAAQGAVDAAQANLDQKLASARSEDLAIAKAQVESTQGALQIAQGAYNNTIITAPVDGTITSVSITAGQIATANTPAIELLSN